METKDGTDEETSAGRPTRQRARLVEHELFPVNASWLDLMPEGAGASTRFVFACLEYGVLEAWQDNQAVVRLYLPEACGGHLIVADPSDDVEPIDLFACDPANTDPDALIQRRGASWVPLLPGIRRSRTRPKPKTTGGEGV